MSYSDLSYDLSRTGGLPGQGVITGVTDGNLLDVSLNGGYDLIDSSWKLSAISVSYTHLTLPTILRV